VPQFADVARSFETDEVWNWNSPAIQDTGLPLFTQAMFLLSQNWTGIISAFGIAVAALLLSWWALRIIPGGPAVREWVILQMPGFGAIYRSSLLARFSQAGALAVSGGQNLPSVLRLAAGATGSGLLMHDAELLGRWVEAGGAIDGAYTRQMSVIPGIVSF